MNYGLQKNGKVKVYYDDDATLMNDLHKLEYVVIDISSPLKGPIYTVVKAKNVSITDQPDLTIGMDISYAAIDCPCCDETTLNFIYKIKTLGNRYSVYPLIEEMCFFNQFKEDFLLTDNYLTINGIHIENKDSTLLELNADNPSTIELNKLFKKMKMRTNTPSLMRSNEYLYFDENKWEVSKSIPSNYNFIFYYNGMQAMYGFSRVEFERLKSIKSFRIDIENIELYEGSEYLESIENVSMGNYLDTNKFSDLVKIMFYYAQEIMLSNLIYKTETRLNFSITVPKRHYHLSITEKESSQGICIFKILNKLLQM